MPHMLIAGSTGSGKSVCINAILIDLLYLNSPSDMRLLLVDPKRVEFTEYNGIPHLLAPVVTEVDKTVSLLKWVVAEMERRFKLFAESSCRNIAVYNENPTEGKLPYIVVVIDELADLMTQAANDVETSIVRIAQMARAVGIHLIVATQRPSVDVITGLIKANIPTRVAFAVASNADSRTILDQGGAEKLLGRGDMLFMSTDVPQPRRAQSVLVTDKEIRAVTDYLKREGEALYDESITNFKANAPHGGMSNETAVDDDLFEEAKTLVVQSGKASASLLQRRLRVGYARAARLLDLLEQEGIIGPPDGAKPREILVSDDQYPTADGL
jgi:S-DNA-T family DNA segregation ATPase FtsK/SpoIIIE